MLGSADGKNMLRFLGGSYYEDLVAEAKTRNSFPNSDYECRKLWKQ